jgi:hypothetical protein
MLIFALALFVAPGITLAQGGDASFAVTNNTGTPVNQLHVSAASQGGWGQDRLGSGTLANGSSFRVQLPAGQCINDVRIVFADGRKIDRRHVNTCQEKEVVFR